MQLIDMLQNRRSVRKYSDEAIDDDSLKQILQAGLLSASSRGKKPWEFIVVKDRKMLDKMALCRNGSANMLKDAFAAIVVIADPDVSDVWTEDCSIAMSNMHLMADSLGIGSCWIQGRLRQTANGTDTETYLRELLGFPDNYRLEAMLSLGMSNNHPKPHTLDELNLEKIHYEKY